MSGGLRRSAVGALLTVVTASAVGCSIEVRPPGETRDDEGEATAAAAASAGPSSPDDAAERAIPAMLEASAGAWNAGDLEGFLDDYSDAAELTFVGSSGVTRGKDGVRERYLAGYWAPDSPRDSLRFEEIEVRALGDGHALAHGRWILYRPEEGEESLTGEGRFSLVLRWEDGVWRIVHDHSS